MRVLRLLAFLAAARHVLTATGVTLERARMDETAWVKLQSSSDIGDFAPLLQHRLSAVQSAAGDVVAGLRWGSNVTHDLEDFDIDTSCGSYIKATKPWLNSSVARGARRHPPQLEDAHTKPSGEIHARLSFDLEMELTAIVIAKKGYFHLFHRCVYLGEKTVKVVGFFRYEANVKVKLQPVSPVAVANGGNRSVTLGFRATLQRPAQGDSEVQFYMFWSPHDPPHGCSITFFGLVTAGECSLFRRWFLDKPAVKNLLRGKIAPLGPPSVIKRLQDQINEALGSVVIPVEISNTVQV